MPLMRLKPITTEPAMKAALLLSNPHPGETLKEALGDLGITQYRLAQDTGLPHSRITSIIQGRQGITAATVLRFGKYFGTPPEYWLNLQHLHDLAAAREEQADALALIRPLVA
jgi:addiction module HigA family antidote